MGMVDTSKVMGFEQLRPTSRLTGSKHCKKTATAKVHFHRKLKITGTLLSADVHPNSFANSLLDSELVMVRGTPELDAGLRPSVVEGRG
jgi:hypothetical protein